MDDLDHLDDNLKINKLNEIKTIDSNYVSTEYNSNQNNFDSTTSQEQDSSYTNKTIELEGNVECKTKYNTTYGIEDNKITNN